MDEIQERVDILLVDDRPANLAALEAILEQLGQNLFLAYSGGEALRLLLERDFALILLDVKMPVLDGFETARLIRERERSARTPIIFLTGINEGHLPVFQAYSLGAVDYLIKPFEAEFLRSKVSVFVDLALKTRQVQRSAEALRLAERQQHERELLQRQMEAGLAQQRWLEGVLGAMPTALVLLDTAPPRVLFANPAARALAGGAFASLEPLPPGLHFTDGQGGELTVEDLPGWRAIGGSRLEGELVEFTGPWGAGAVRAWSERLGAMSGHSETVLLAVEDVTELKEAETGLLAAVRAREDFIAVGSHELRTPLTALKLQVSVALRGLARQGPAAAPPETVVNHLRRMKASIERLERLSEYLLDVSRISAGILQLDCQPVDLAALTAEVVERLEPQLAQGGCKTRVTAARVVGTWDRTRLDQAISNLVVNAIKYAPGAPIEVDVRSANGRATIAVRDHGPGIAPELQQRVFERFERAVQPVEGGGFGLGLWLVREIASLHGGTIDLQSRPSEGALFTLSLPLAAAQAAPAEAALPQ
jgi:signal transduction histidine kinase